VAGGNAWCLAHNLRLLGLADPIRKRVAEGAPLLAWGAGAVMASPTIVTTADHPTCDPRGVEGLHLVPFHIAALPAPCDHQTDDHCSACGEAEARVVDVSVGEADRWIVGLPPKGGLLVADRHVDVVGTEPVRVFRAGRARAHLGRGNQARFLLDEGKPRSRRIGHHQPQRCRRG
jgi:dipeptidase E